MFRITTDCRKPLVSVLLTGFVLIAGISNVFSQTKDGDGRLLKAEQTITRELKGADQHRYKIAAQAEELIQITVEQKEADLVLKLFGANGKLLFTRNERKNIGEPETLSFVAAVGEYVLEVGMADEKAAAKNYTIQRAAFKKATAEDRRRTEAENAPVGNAAGDWTIVVTTKQGDLQFTLAVEQKGKKLSGSVQSAYGDGVVKDGTITGNAVSLTVTSQILEANLKGVLEGDKMKGTITSSIPNIGELPFVGTRAK